MKYIALERIVAAFEDSRYEARLDRAKQNVEDYMQKIMFRFLIKNVIKK